MCDESDFSGVDGSSSRGTLGLFLAFLLLMMLGMVALLKG